MSDFRNICNQLDLNPEEAELFDGETVTEELYNNAGFNLDCKLSEARLPSYLTDGRSAEEILKELLYYNLRMPSLDLSRIIKDEFEDENGVLYYYDEVEFDNTKWVRSGKKVECYIDGKLNYTGTLSRMASDIANYLLSDDNTIVAYLEKYYNELDSKGEGDDIKNSLHLLKKYGMIDDETYNSLYYEYDYLFESCNKKEEDYNLNIVNLRDGKETIETVDTVVDGDLATKLDKDIDGLWAEKDFDIILDEDKKFARDDIKDFVLIALPGDRKGSKKDLSIEKVSARPSDMMIIT